MLTSVSDCSGGSVLTSVSDCSGGSGGFSSRRKRKSVAGLLPNSRGGGWLSSKSSRNEGEQFSSSLAGLLLDKRSKVSLNLRFLGVGESPLLELRLDIWFSESNID